MRFCSTQDYQSTSLASYQASGNHRPLCNGTAQTRASRRGLPSCQPKPKVSSTLLSFKIVIPATWRIGNTKSGSTHLLGELAVPQANDLDILGCLGSQVCVRGLDGLEHSGDLAGSGVHLRAIESQGRVKLGVGSEG